MVNMPVLLRCYSSSVYLAVTQKVLFNAKVRFTDSYSRCDNNVVHAFGS